jgi:hypothetical protein
MSSFTELRLNHWFGSEMNTPLSDMSIQLKL